MSVLDTLKGFAVDLFNLNKRVDKNSEDIAELRRNMKTLSGFSQKIANVVKYNQTKAEFTEKQADSKYEKLVLQLKVELLELERRLNTPTIGNSVLLSQDDAPDSDTELPPSSES